MTPAVVQGRGKRNVVLRQEALQQERKLFVVFQKATQSPWCQPVVDGEKRGQSFAPGGQPAPFTERGRQEDKPADPQSQVDYWQDPQHRPERGFGKRIQVGKHGGRGYKPASRVDPP